MARVLSQARKNHVRGRATRASGLSVVFTVQPETHSELIAAARKIEFESCK